MRYVTDIRFYFIIHKRVFHVSTFSIDTHEPSAATENEKSFLMFFSVEIFLRFHSPGEIYKNTKQTWRSFAPSSLSDALTTTEKQEEPHPTSGQKNQNKLLRSGSLIISLQTARDIFFLSVFRSSRTFVNLFLFYNFLRFVACRFTPIQRWMKMFSSALSSPPPTPLSFTPGFFITIFLFLHTTTKRSEMKKRRKAEAQECGVNDIYRNFNTCKGWNDIILPISCLPCEKNSNECKCSLFSLLWGEKTFNPMETYRKHLMRIYWMFFAFFSLALMRHRHISRCIQDEEILVIKKGI